MNKISAQKIFAKAPKQIDGITGIAPSSVGFVKNPSSCAAIPIIILLKPKSLAPKTAGFALRPVGIGAIPTGIAPIPGGF